MGKPRRARKLLIASIGVATLSYGVVSCSSAATPGDASDAGRDVAADLPVANLVAPPDVQPDVRPDAARDVMDDFPVANLVAPPTDARPDTLMIDDFPVANLVAPPVDSGG